MDKAELAKLAVALYAQLAEISGYKMPEHMPEVHAFPKQVVQDLVCGSPCHILAFYHPDFGLIVEEGLSTDRAYDRSVVLHELVHHAQHQSGKFDNLESACKRRAAAEEEAFTLQNRYLAHEGSEPVPLFGFDRMCQNE